MPRVFIPPLLRSQTDGVSQVEMEATTVRQIVAELEHRYPGLKNKLAVDGQLKSGLQVAVNGTLSSVGLLQKVAPDSEVHFLSAVGGG